MCDKKECPFTDFEIAMLQELCRRVVSARNELEQPYTNDRNNG